MILYNPFVQPFCCVVLLSVCVSCVVGSVAGLVFAARVCVIMATSNMISNLLELVKTCAQLIAK